jgi:hypothetical protein
VEHNIVGLPEISIKAKATILNVADLEPGAGIELVGATKVGRHPDNILIQIN